MFIIYIDTWTLPGSSLTIFCGPDRRIVLTLVRKLSSGILLMFGEKPTNLCICSGFVSGQRRGWEGARTLPARWHWILPGALSAQIAIKRQSIDPFHLPVG
jgi:hypothetical protein